MVSVPRVLPEFETERLRLRSFTLADAGDVQRYAGDFEVARMTTNIPHPYADGMAEEWISTHDGEHAAGAALTWAVASRHGGALLGAIGIVIDRENEAGEIGYWIGKPYWGCGYATEAAKAVIDCGFDTDGLHRIYARHFTHNPASGRVMQKAGMRYEGTLRHVTRRFGAWCDFAYYSVLETERCK